MDYGSHNYVNYTNLTYTRPPWYNPSVHVGLAARLSGLLFFELHLYFSDMQKYSLKTLYDVKIRMSVWYNVCTVPTHQSTFIFVGFVIRNDFLVTRWLLIIIYTYIHTYTTILQSVQGDTNSTTTTKTSSSHPSHYRFSCDQDLIPTNYSYLGKIK